MNIKVTGNNIHTSVYDKRDDFGFPIVNFPWLSGDVPRLPSYGIYISQLVRFARCCTSVFLFYYKNLQITSILLTQGYTYHKLRSWLAVLRINVDLAIFQPYLDLEVGNDQSLKIQVARPGIEPRSSCSASQELLKPLGHRCSRISFVKRLESSLGHTLNFCPKDYFGLKCILSYYVPVQTIVSPYDANCVTPLIYPTTDLDFLFGIIVSFDLSFYFFFIFLKPAHNLFVNGIIPSLVLP